MSATSGRVRWSSRRSTRSSERIALARGSTSRLGDDEPPVTTVMRAANGRRDMQGEGNGALMSDQTDPGVRSKTVLRHRSLPESVHEILRYRILNNDLPSGAPLLEVALAEEFGVSRTTIRSAMRELQAERLVEITPRRGTTVSRMSEQDAREVCFARYTFEAVSLKETTKSQRRRLADDMQEVVSAMELC